MQVYAFPVLTLQYWKCLCGWATSKKTWPCEIPACLIIDFSVFGGISSDSCPAIVTFASNSLQTEKTCKEIGRLTEAARQDYDLFVLQLLHLLQLLSIANLTDVGYAIPWVA